MNTIDTIMDIAHKSKLTNIVFKENLGNRGDDLIKLGRQKLFKENNLNISVISNRNKPRNSIIIYEGGGAFHPDYPWAMNFIDKVSDPKLNNQIIVLPHSVVGDVVINRLSKVRKDCLTIIAREIPTYNRISCLENIRSEIDHDTALYLTRDDLIDYIGAQYVGNYSSNNPVLIALRTDKESVFDRDNKENKKLRNMDLSESCKDLAEFLHIINSHETIITDRLHVGVAAAILGKKTLVADNNYGKISSIYDFSLKYRFPNMSVISKDKLNDTVKQYS